jgi:hypothetical protein
VYGRFPILTDEHISSSLVKALRDLGWEVFRVVDEKDLGRGTLDPIVFAYAAKRGWVWLSRDAGALRHPKEWLEQQKAFRGMLSWPQDRPMSIGDVVRFVEALAQEDAPFASGVRHLKPPR